MIHGHSSHHVKGLEVWHGKLCLYGCGDFLSDYEGISNPHLKGSLRDDLGLMYYADIAPASGTQ